MNSVPRFYKRSGPSLSFFVTRPDPAGSAAAQSAADLKPMRYGLLGRFIDRRNANRDGRSRCPDVGNLPEPTPYIQGLVANFVKQAANVRERFDKDMDMDHWRQLLDQVSVDIQIAQGTLITGQERFDSTQPTTADAAWHDPEVKAWRQQRNHQMKQQLETVITNLNKQCLNRQLQLAAHTWIRIETYWGRLVQIHPDGELISGWINNWRPTQLAGTLQKLIELNETEYAQPIR
jgi:hypothetical protein